MRYEARGLGGSEMTDMLRNICGDLGLTTRRRRGTESIDVLIPSCSGYFGRVLKGVVVPAITFTHLPDGTWECKVFSAACILIANTIIDMAIAVSGNRFHTLIAKPYNLPEGEL
jgi:hypothetical protein